MCLKRFSALKCRIQNHGRASSISCAEFCRLHGFLTDMQQSFQYFGQAHAGQLQQTEAMEALQHAGQCLARPLVSLYCLAYFCIASASFCYSTKFKFVSGPVHSLGACLAPESKTRDSSNGAACKLCSGRATTVVWCNLLAATSIA